ncbi:YdeI/OmpD-associated family protein [Alkaliphilus transvaalensis]|uniref:YdeI/OmpD-associated family protein n=1 Tax=Alkaliphilus transvaalensis TaxID=114628 RepID=UPI001FA794E1|nr:YdeI/OmpD-associated family protein [Alkaliphilus transvaalensis]
MTDNGRKVLPDMSRNAFIIDEVIERRLKEDEERYLNFMKFPEFYRLIRIDTIQQVKNQPELFKKRLDKFIENTKQGKMYGAWNNHGRLCRKMLCSQIYYSCNCIEYTKPIKGEGE